MAPARSTYREALAVLADKAKAAIPELNGRVEGAVSLVLAGDVELHADGTAMVGSSTDARKAYAVAGSCSCQDAPRAPKHLCKHKLSAVFALRLREQDVAPEASDVSPAPVGALPAAPASVNLKVLIAGHEVQVTLRDVDESRLLGRLQALLKLPEIRPLPKPASRAGGWKRNYQGR